MAKYDKSSKLTAEKILKDLRHCHEKRRPWLKEAIEDVEFAVGQQWKDEDKRELEAIGAPALTINKIQPNLFLLSGIQRQSRTDLKAYPEGTEDSLEGEIVTHLLKNISKRSQANIKLSEQFEDGTMCGEGWVEPYIDYTYDMLNGHMKIKKDSPFDIYVDPSSTEYDLSDARYVIKVTEDLTKDQLLELFPEKEKTIDNIKNGKIDIDVEGQTNKKRKRVRDQYAKDDTARTGEYNEEEEVLFDLVEYYYKKYVKKYMVVSKRLAQIREVADKKEAEQIVAAMQQLEQKEYESTGQMWDMSMTGVKVIPKVVPEIWMGSCAGDELIEEKKSWSYPNWKSYPLFRFKAHYITIPIDKTENMVQGVVRSLKDPQRELNKRRSQELRILNSQPNSGYLGEEGSFVKKDNWKKFGSTPGIILEYKKGTPKPEKLAPAQFPAAHAMSAEENKNDMKEISGINADLLAMQEGGVNSGRAMIVRQKQGTVMVQKLFDNFSQTKILFGKFLLSQLGEIYTIETALKVLGRDFIEANFSVPQVDPQTGQPMTGPDGELLKSVDPEMVKQVINNILVNSKDVDAYDIEIGEIAMTETIKYANSLTLQDLVKSGYPIPPEVLFEDSGLSKESKNKIKQANEEQQKMQLAMQQQGKNITK